jgi:hypothetical protein
MKIVSGFDVGFYEVKNEVISYKGPIEEILLFSDLDIVDPEEFVERFRTPQEDDWFGSWFGEEDLYLLSSLF